mmetsp:Transcript_18969/g.61841  ORF Transcript_18969/g.61841 Transcript_18969/m.61841 type:complete len:367 (+) Transcript_18969:1751-2851(+)
MIGIVASLCSMSHYLWRKRSGFDEFVGDEREGARGSDSGGSGDGSREGCADAALPDDGSQRAPHGGRRRVPWLQLAARLGEVERGGGCGAQGAAREAGEAVGGDDAPPRGGLAPRPRRGVEEPVPERLERDPIDGAERHVPREVCRGAAPQPPRGHAPALCPHCPPNPIPHPQTRRSRPRRLHPLHACPHELHWRGEHHREGARPRAGDERSEDRILARRDGARVSYVPQNRLVERQVERHGRHRHDERRVRPSPQHADTLAPGHLPQRIERTGVRGARRQAHELRPDPRAHRRARREPQSIRDRPPAPRSCSRLSLEARLDHLERVHHERRHKRAPSGCDHPVRPCSLRERLARPARRRHKNYDP